MNSSKSDPIGNDFKLDCEPRSFIQCESRDSNPDALRHWILNPARLPIPPHSQCRKPDFSESSGR